MPCRLTVSVCYAGWVSTPASALPANVPWLLPTPPAAAGSPPAVRRSWAMPAMMPPHRTFRPDTRFGQRAGTRVGTALLLRCLTAMREHGYGYAIIGSVGPVAFYEKNCHATVIPDSDPGILQRFFCVVWKSAANNCVVHFLLPQRFYNFPISFS